MYAIPATTYSPATTPPKRQPVKVSQITAAHTRIAELSQQHPSWPDCRVRRAVARELDISTVKLRYILSKKTDC